MLVKYKNALCFLEKKLLTKFKMLSNNRYRQINLKNLIYYINYTLLKNNHIILTLINFIYYFLFYLTKKQIVKFFCTLHGTAYIALFTHTATHNISWNFQSYIYLLFRLQIFIPKFRLGYFTPSLHQLSNYKICCQSHLYIPSLAATPHAIIQHHTK